MPHFLIRSKGESRYTVRVADCTFEHAESVLATVKASPGCPDDLEMVETLNLYDDPLRVPWWRRLTGG